MSKSSSSEEVIFQNNLSDGEDDSESGLFRNTDYDSDNVSTFLLDLLRPIQDNSVINTQVNERFGEYSNKDPGINCKENIDDAAPEIDDTSTSNSARRTNQSIGEEIVTLDYSIVANPTSLNEDPTEVPRAAEIDTQNIIEKTGEKKTIEDDEHYTTGKDFKSITTTENKDNDKQELESHKPITDDLDDGMIGGEQVVTTMIAPKQRIHSREPQSMFIISGLNGPGPISVSDIVSIMPLVTLLGDYSEEDEGTADRGYIDEFSYEMSPCYQTNKNSKTTANFKGNKSNTQMVGTHTSSKAATKTESPSMIRTSDKRENSKNPITECTNAKRSLKTGDNQTWNPGSKTLVINPNASSSVTTVNETKDMSRPGNNTSDEGAVPTDTNCNARATSWINQPWHLSVSDFIVLDCDVSGVQDAQKADVNQNKNQRKTSRLKRYVITKTYYTRANSGSKHDEIMDSSQTNPYTQMAAYLKEKNPDMLMEMTGDMYGSSAGYSPCMQCYEQKKAGGGYSDMSSAAMVTADGRCASCGGALMTIGSMGKSMLGLKRLTEQQGLTAIDVFPDGNCQFASVLDQLRSRGIFTYTPHTIRLAAVNYLREHPYADKDTHLQMFLVNEDWEEYLARMACDGEWGDHLTLKALCNVIDMKIVVYKGVEKATTVLLPDRFQTNTTENTDEEKQVDIPTIVIAHMGDSHYLSLRNKDWRTNLSHRATQVDIPCKIPMSYNIYHIDCLIKILTQLDYIYSLNLTGLSSDGGSSEGDIVGHLFMRMHPDVDTVKTLFPNVMSFFQLPEDEQKPEPYVVTLLMSDNDSRARTMSSSASKFDLIIEPVAQSETNLLHLVPAKAKFWSGSTQKTMDDRDYLMSVDKYKIVARPDRNAIFHKVLSFRCSWPQVAADWLHRYSSSGLPSPSDRQQMIELGCHTISAVERTVLNDVLDIYVTEEMAENKALWCYSFAVAERYLCSKVLSDYHRKAFLVFKLLVDQTLMDQPLPTSVVKSVYYYGCERVSVDDWRTQAGACVLIMLQKLIYGLEIGYIPHYFIPSQNLLTNIPGDIVRSCAASLSHINEHPLMHLFFILDSNNILETEVGTFFDSMIEDMVAYSSSNNILQTVNRISYTATITLMVNLAIRKDYDKGFLVLRDMVKQMNLYTTHRYTTTTLLRSIAPNFQWVELWPFATYIDILTDSNMVENFLKYWNIESAPLSEWFGTQLPARIHQRPMPVYVNPLEYGCILVGTYMISVLEQCDLYEYRIPALRFFVDKLAEFSDGGLLLDITCTCHNLLDCPTFQQSQMWKLFQIYTVLMCLYSEEDRMDEFRPLMTTFNNIVESLQSPICYKWLCKTWEFLGAKDEAMKARRQTTACRSCGTMGQMMMTMMMG